MDSLLPVVSALMCHAPIVIPQIGGPRASSCQATTLAMRQAATAICEGKPEIVVVLSPHTPRHRKQFGLISGRKIRGDFRAFGIEGLEVTFDNAPHLLELLVEAGLEIAGTEMKSVDHGAAVPLWFLQETGFQGSVAIVGFPYLSSHRDAIKFGALLRQAMAKQGKPWALLASGDMSHALLPGAPGGFHPKAKAFDQAVMALFKDDRLAELGSIPEDLRELAAEDVMDSLFIASGVLGETRGWQVLSYEGPFGVGYGVARLSAQHAPDVK